MSLANTIQLLTTRVAQEFNSVRADLANTASNVYTKTEVDTALALKADITYVDTGLGLKADQATTYTKTEVDSAVGVKANSADVYTKSEVYTKGETDTAITAGIAAVVDSAPAALDTLKELASALSNDADFSTTITTSIGLKANTADVDSALALKADQSSVDSALALKADQSSVDSALALKADQSSVDSALALKADITYVDTGLGLKADQSTTYTKTEVDGLLSPITTELSDLGALDLVALFESTLV